MMKGAAEVMILLVGVAVQRSIDRLIRTLHPGVQKRIGHRVVKFLTPQNCKAKYE
jgi:hypothetical protein